MMHRKLNVLATWSILMTSVPLDASADEPIQAPQWKVGDRWTYRITVNPGDTCTKNLTTGATQTFEVGSADAAGYEIRRETNGNATKQKWAVDLTTTSKVGFNDAKTDAYGFPMTKGKTWQSGWLSMFGNGTVKTELSCEALDREKIIVPAGEFETVPIVCKGTWTNLTYRAGDQAVAKYWYSPSERNHVKFSLSTIYQGGVCVDWEWSLIRTP